ncbi:unnamed protein product, partial [Hapterophycus canaliculatus]
GRFEFLPLAGQKEAGVRTCGACRFIRVERCVCACCFFGRLLLYRRRVSISLPGWCTCVDRRVLQRPSPSLLVRGVHQGTPSTNFQRDEGGTDDRSVLHGIATSEAVVFVSPGECPRNTSGSEMRVPISAE